MAAPEKTRTEANHFDSKVVTLLGILCKTGQPCISTLETSRRFAADHTSSATSATSSVVGPEAGLVGDLEGDFKDLEGGVRGVNAVIRAGSPIVSCCDGSPIDSRTREYYRDCGVGVRALCGNSGAKGWARPAVRCPGSERGGKKNVRIKMRGVALTRR